MAGKGGVGVWEPPPTRAMMAYSAAFSAAAAIALLIGRCDIGGILAAIAFVFGLIGSVEFLVWRSTMPPTARSETDDPGVGGTGVWEPPPTSPMVLGTGGTGALLAALFAVLLERCPLATALAFIALVLLLLALLRIHSMGRRS